MQDSERLLPHPPAAKLHSGEEEEEGEQSMDEQEQAPGNYGSTSLSVRFQTVEKPAGISWHNLNIVHPKSKRVILNNVSGMAKPGQLIALMGGSGAGKTTLLNTLLSRNLKKLTLNGDVLVNGHAMGEAITFVSGYVQQDELFMGTLTVKEHLLVQARLRLVGWNATQIKKRVSEIIDELGLYGCRHARIGTGGIKKGISGGEARRLLFACELLSNPQIIFADEPTTGLDSSMAESLVRLMKKLTVAGRTVICTIHQPSSAIYRQFDRVMFLVSGRVAFYGEPTKAMAFLGTLGYPCPHNYNPADAIIEYLSIEPNKEKVCQERVALICDEWEKSTEGKQFIEEVEKQRELREKPDMRKQASFLTQTGALLRRAATDNLRNPGLTRAKLSQKLIMGLFIGLLYWQTSPLSILGMNNLNGAMFYIVVELTYSTLFGIITFLPYDFPLLVREYHDGLYDVGAYYIARVLSYMPLFALDGTVLVATSYWMTGLAPTLYRFGIAIGIAILVEQSAAAFGVMLSTASPSYPIAISAAGPIVTVLALTGGLFANVGTLPKFISWVQYLSWFRYGFEAFAISQWEGAFDNTVAGNCTTETGAPCPSARSVLRNYSFHPEMFMLDIIAMIFCTFLFYYIGFVGLYLRVRRAR